MKTQKKNAQMEIMGLAIIVILLSLAILFVVQFVILKQPTDIKKEFTHEELSKNTVSTLLSTTTGCREMKLKDLLEDCAEGGFIQCPSGNSCSYSNQIIEEILTNTLEVWNKDYYLTIKVGTEDILLPFGISCPGEKTTSHPCCVLPTGYGNLIVTLEICG